MIMARRTRGSNILFACDPEKNRKCNRHACFVDGGPCMSTHDMNCAKIDKDGYVVHAVDLDVAYGDCIIRAKTIQEYGPNSGCLVLIVYAKREGEAQ